MKIDISGQRFGRLVVLRQAGINNSRNATWDCVCDCGVQKVISGRSLRMGLTKSCGCYQKQRASETFSRPLLERFMEKVSKTDTCWLWVGAIDKETGYGKIGISHDEIEGTHRVSYRLFNGEIPNGLDVCHKCNIRPCVNPEHLYAGTRKQNMEQASKEGRLKGRNHAGNRP